MATRKVDSRTSVVPSWVAEAIEQSGVKLDKKDAMALFNAVWDNMAIEFARTGKLSIRKFGTLHLKTYVNKDLARRHRTRWILATHTKEVIRDYDNDLLNRESLPVKISCVLCGNSMDSSEKINAICKDCAGEN